MKTIKLNKYNLFLLLGGLTTLFYSCHQRIEPEYEYADFRRVIGPEGGVINFYEYNPQDSIPRVLVKMEFPAGALDTFVVFNMYKFYDQQTYIDLLLVNMEEKSEFLYFIPFYESYGYNEQTQSETDYHLSIDFKDTVTVTYNLSGYPIDETTKFYQIPIPKKDDPEWEDNVWVNWNDQGYPDGYDNLDLIYLITGRWTINDSWGTGTPSTNNWIEFPYFHEFNTTDSTMTFKITNTDYMYVMGLPTVK